MRGVNEFTSNNKIHNINQKHWCFLIHSLRFCYKLRFLRLPRSLSRHQMMCSFLYLFRVARYVLGRENSPYNLEIETTRECVGDVFGSKNSRQQKNIQSIPACGWCPRNKDDGRDGIVGVRCRRRDFAMFCEVFCSVGYEECSHRCDGGCAITKKKPIKLKSAALAICRRIRGDRAEKRYGTKTRLDRLGRTSKRLPGALKPKPKQNHTQGGQETQNAEIGIGDGVTDTERQKTPPSWCVRGIKVNLEIVALTAHSAAFRPECTHITYTAHIHTCDIIS